MNLYKTVGARLSGALAFTGLIFAALATVMPVPVMAQCNDTGYRSIGHRINAYHPGFFPSAPSPKVNAHQQGSTDSFDVTGAVVCWAASSQIHLLTFPDGSQADICFSGSVNGGPDDDDLYCQGVVRTIVNCTAAKTGNQAYRLTATVSSADNPASTNDSSLSVLLRNHGGMNADGCQFTCIIQ